VGKSREEESNSLVSEGAKWAEKPKQKEK